MDPRALIDVLTKQPWYQAAWKSHKLWDNVANACQHGHLNDLGQWPFKTKKKTSFKNAMDCPGLLMLWWNIPLVQVLLGAMGVLMGAVSIHPMLDHSGLIEFRDWMKIIFVVNVPWHANLFFNLSHHFSRGKKGDQHEPSALAPVHLCEIMHVWSVHDQFMFVLTHFVDVIAQTTHQKAKLKNFFVSSLHAYGIDKLYLHYF